MSVSANTLPNMVSRARLLPEIGTACANSARVRLSCTNGRHAIFTQHVVKACESFHRHGQFANANFPVSRIMELQTTDQIGRPYRTRRLAVNMAEMHEVFDSHQVQAALSRDMLERYTHPVYFEVSPDMSRLLANRNTAVLDITHLWDDLYLVDIITDRRSADDGIEPMTTFEERAIPGLTLLRRDLPRFRRFG